MSYPFVPQQSLAFELAQQWLADECLVLDTETTGLGDTAEICEICILNHRGETLLDTLVKPQQQIPDDVIAIHGITNEMVKNAPAFDQLLPEINQIISGKTLVAYNQPYDYRLLEQSAKACGLGHEDVALHNTRTACAMAAYSQHAGIWDEARNAYKRHRLVDAARGIELPKGERPHRAHADCYLTLWLLRHMAGKVDQIMTKDLWRITRNIGDPNTLLFFHKPSAAYCRVFIDLAWLQRSSSGYVLCAADKDRQLLMQLIINEQEQIALQRMFPALKALEDAQ
ncbi:3'-5' exonuclease [Shewanella dokdonensis]|uniref:3'-5' exonuclease n=1 Tax=Shewanella dokdonensis TaxID=712036 RepID=A0ABX8DEX8_9GAMM|nr:3'-5' exonuclease [Shewanella dokdonensis]MCL1076484.1 3'-5' exonuclease [Shewanella dokdonensis]QVK23294.1 3'-5' exonuclease [Shewanella dokdonensis]